MSDKAKTTAGKAKRRKLRRAQHWGSRVLPASGKILTLLIVMMIMGLMFSALQAIKNTWLRAGMALVILAGMLFLHINEGMNQGAEDAASSVSYMQGMEAGRKLGRSADAACYHPLKALCSALAVYAIPLVMALYVALAAKPYSYQLQDLPLWLTDTYGARGDVMGPLGAYTAREGLAVFDWIRMLVRLPQMMYVMMFPDALTMSLMIDRLSPLCIAAYPLAYVVGYLFGPASNRRMRKQNRRAKKAAVHKASKSSLAAELTGVQNAVHYGQRREEDKHKRRELV
ncbi:MAG: hypothetical protein IKK34_10720 [Clostridia bacterium]|nr:hypothetical protein [Clostridia bacterium]